MSMIEKLIAGTMAAVCLVLMVRLLLGRKRQQRLDRAVRYAWLVCRDFARSCWRWRSSRKEAARQAQEAIERARKAGEWDGNVYTPKSFQRPRKPH